MPVIGQDFSPNSNDPQFQQQQGSGASPLQQAIQILRIRMPHLFGGGAPAAPQLLHGGGFAPPTPLPFPTMPFQGGGPMMGNPGSPMAPPSMAGGQGGPMAPPSAPMPSFGGPQNGQGAKPGVPGLHFQPPPPTPGGTAGPNPGEFESPRPFPGRGNRRSSF